MGVVVVGGTGSTSIATDIVSMVHTNSEVHTHSEAHTHSDTGLVGKVQDGSAIVPIQPEPAHRSSSSRCLPSFPSRVGMLYNPSLHGLLTYKI